MKSITTLRLLKTITVFFILSSLSVTTVSASLPIQMSPNEPGALIVKQTILPWMQKNKIPGVAVDIYLHGQPSAYFFGYASLATKMPIKSDTIFELGSITKLFTSLLLAEEINSGQANLNNKLSQYMPDLALLKNTVFNQVTLKNLATYTAGLPFELPPQIKNRGQFPNYFTSWQPLAPLGTKWTYSNVSIGLLGDALETMTHQNFNQLYRNKILAPLGMAPIGIIVPQRYIKNAAQGYTKTGQATQPTSMGLFPAAYAMKASAHDLLLFLGAALRVPGTPTQIANAMKLTQTSYFHVANFNQGLVWVIHPHPENNQQKLLEPPTDMNFGPFAAQPLNKNRQHFDANTLIDKTGATNGFRAYIALMPKQKSGVVILANRYVSNGEIQKVGREILFAMTQ